MSNVPKDRFKLGESIRRLVRGGSVTEQGCTHLDQIRDVTPSADGCEDCLQTGDKWVHLRICMTCGYVGCCDNSKNRHARAHYHTTGHEIIQSFEPGEEWLWCYADQVLISPK